MKSVALASAYLAAAMVSACAAAPAAPTAGLTTPTLAAGSYTLRTNPDADPATLTACAASGSVSASGAVPVTVTTDGRVWTLRPSLEADRGLVITIGIAGATFDGTASGRAIDGQTTVTFGTEGAQPQPARLSGLSPSTNVITGTMTGSVSFESAGGSALCVGYAWSLHPST